MAARRILSRASSMVTSCPRGEFAAAISLRRCADDDDVLWMWSGHAGGSRRLPPE